MLHILLLLLKIIGIVLLALIGLFVLVILLVLFVPVRYDLRVEEKESIFVRTRVSWLLHLLHASAVYDGEFRVVIRLFGIPVRRIPAPQKPVKEKKQSGKKQTKKDAGEASYAGQGISIPEDAGPDTCSIAKTDGAQSAGSAAISAPEADEGSNADGNEPKENGADTESIGQTEADGTVFGESEAEKRSFFQKLARFFRAVRAFFSKILYTIRHICDKIETVRETIAYYLEVLKSDEGQRTFALVKQELGKLLRHIAPTKLKGNLTIGMDDPAATGQIIAILSMFYPIYGDNVSITPDFDEKRIEGSLYLKGRIRAITLIRIAWRIYFNKDMKKFLHMLKREENKA